MTPSKCAKCATASGWVSVAGNVGLAAVKWVVGASSGSQALLADALHSSVDVLGSCITLIMLKLSKRDRTKRYPYGFGKLEDVAALAIYLILIFAGVWMVSGAIASLIAGDSTAPGILAIFAAALSIAVNAFMYGLISCAGRQAKSPSLLALGYENKVDAMSSVAALVGIVGAILGFPALDPIAAIVVSAIIITESCKELWHACQKLTDVAVAKPVRVEIERLTLSTPHVMGVLSIKSRYLGATAHADIDIFVDGDASVEVAQLVADAVADRVRAGVEEIDGVHVYTHPHPESSSPRDARLSELLSVMREHRGLY